jgi:DNA-binding winged helix-turn-helix (wHTH) protein
MKLLEILVERPGEVVTREELRSRVWPSESFGDFDQALNIAVGKLRSALGDSAENPRFIETLPNVVIALLRTCRLSMQTLAKKGRNPRMEI